MPPRDPSKIQLDFPQLTADVIDQLNLVGTVGLLDFAPTVLPVFIIGDRDLSVDASPPVYTSAQIFTGSVFNPAAASVMATTGPLPAGTYDVFGQIGFTGGSVAAGQVQMQHRNAADAVNLAIMAELALDGGTGRVAVARMSPIGYVIAENERIRVQISTLGAGKFWAQIFAAIRPIP